MLHFSEPLAAMLRADEAKLLDGRKALAEASAAASPAPPPPAYSSRAMVAVVEDIATAAAAKPQKAKELLRGVVESILMTPAPDGYAVRVALKSISPAALEGDGADICKIGCGSPQACFQQSCRPVFTGLLTPYRPALSPEPRPARRGV